MRETSARRVKITLAVKAAQCALCGLFVYLLAGCATPPAARLPPPSANRIENAFAQAALPANAGLYLFASVPRADSMARALLKQYRMDTKTTRAVLEKSRALCAAVFLDNEPAFALNLEGRGYPAFLAALSFAFSPDWRRAGERGRRCWYSTRYKLALNVSARHIRLSAPSLASAPAPASAPAAPPPGFSAWSEDALISGWTPGAQALNAYLRLRKIHVRIPAKTLFGGIFKAADADGGGLERGYQLMLRVEAENAARANSLQSLLNITLNMLAEEYERRPSGPGKLFLGAAVRMEDATVTLTSRPFSEADALTLLGSLSTAIRF